MQPRATYETVFIGEQLGPEDIRLALEWAEYVGDETREVTIDIDGEPTDGLFGLQAFEVGTYGHEVVINGEPLSGFDIPPNDGWQYWMDALTGATLQSGENTIKIVRDPGSDDAFAIGMMVLQWKDSADK